MPNTTAVSLSLMPNAKKESDTGTTEIHTLSSRLGTTSSSAMKKFDALGSASIKTVSDEMDTAISNAITTVDLKKKEDTRSKLGGVFVW